MGYGYGIWLISNNKYLKTFISHIPHITIMCNMSLLEATNAYNDIINTFGKKNKVYIHGICEYFNGSYNNVDTLHSCGYHCNIDKWVEIKTICSKYKGVIPLNPHMTTQYNISFRNLQLIHHIPAYDICDIKLVNICDDYPMKWNIIIPQKDM